jgi:hypothetical protein
MQLRRKLASFARLEQKQDRDGLALAAVLLALLLIAALIAGAFSATTEETRMVVAAAARETALLNAESAIEVAVAALSRGADDPISVGETRDRRVDGLSPPVVVHVTRLGSSLYWLVADAEGPSPNSGIARRIGVIVRARSGSDHSIIIDRASDRGWAELF